MAFWRDDIDPTLEPTRVLIKRGELFDEKRNRKIPYKIYYPDIKTNEPLPVIVWSHGLGGTQDGAGFIARFLASHGYVHINIGHDGTNDSLWRGKTGHPWDNIRKATITWETVRNRYLDVPYLLDSLPTIDLPVALDMNAVGMSGHSFGAVTTQIMAGQLTGMDTLESLYEDRFIAALAYSPVPNTRVQNMEPNIIYGPIKTPMMHLTGTEDFSPLDGPIQHYAMKFLSMQGKMVRYSYLLFWIRQTIWSLTGHGVNWVHMTEWTKTKTKSKFWH
jgi:hypothetical protein